MASYHLRVKDDTRQSGSKVSAKRHELMRTTSTAKERRATAMIVSSKEVSYPNGRKVLLKNFSARRPVMRIRETAGTKKSNCLCQTN